MGLLAVRVGVKLDVLTTAYTESAVDIHESCDPMTESHADGENAYLSLCVGSCTTRQSAWCDAHVEVLAGMSVE